MNPGINFSAQNLRSLNTSTRNEVTLKKLIAITRNKDDVILVSDLRLNTQKNPSVEHDISKICFGLGYNIYTCSKLSSRGVGILINKNLTYVIHNSVPDSISNNFILLDLSFGTKRMTIGSIYGPNLDSEVGYYARLTDSIKALKNDLVLLGGDWNATWDKSKPDKNLDTLNMIAIPSLQRSNAILRMADELNLTDPYRLFYPNRKEFTYIPAAAQQNNRSRIDFFLVSHSFTNCCLNCTIPNSTNGAIFDHKQIFLTFKKTKGPSNLILKDHVFDSVDGDPYVIASVVECYLHHAITTDTFTVEQKDNLLLQIGLILSKLEDVRGLEFKNAGSNFDELRELRIAGLRTEIKLDLEELPGIDFFANLTLSCNNANFFEVLVMCIKNSCLLHQAHTYKAKKAQFNKLNKEISELKKNYSGNVQDILNKERELAAITEAELKKELKHMQRFCRLNNEKITPHFMALTKKLWVINYYKTLGWKTARFLRIRHYRMSTLRTFIKLYIKNMLVNRSFWHQVSKIFLGKLLTMR